MQTERPPASILQDFSFYVAAGTLFLLPAVFNPLLVDAFNLPKVTLFRCSLLLLLGAAAVRLPLAGAVTLTLNSFTLPVAAVLTVNTLSTAFAVNPFHSFFGQHMYHFEGLAATLSYVLLFHLASNSFDGNRLRRLFAWALCGAVLPVAYGLLQAASAEFIGWHGSSSSRIWSSFGNPNFFAGYLVMLIPLLLYFRGAAAGWKKTALGGLLAAAAVCLLLTFSRAGFIGLLAALSLYAAVSGSPRFKRWAAGVAGAVIVAAVILMVVAMHGYRRDTELLRGSGGFAGRVRETVLSRISGEDSSVKARAAFARTALRMCAERPLLGFGPDAFSIVWPRFMTNELARLTGSRTANPGYAHSELLQTLATTGIAGLAAYVWLAFVTLKCGIRAAAARGHSSRLVAAVTASYAGLLVNNQFSFHSPVTAVMSWFLVAYIAVVSPFRRITISFSRSVSAAIAGAALILIAAAGVITVRMYLAEGYFPRGLYLESQSQYGQAVVYFARASRMNPFEHTYYQNLGKVSISAASRARTMEERTAYLNGAVNAYRKHLSLIPQDAMSWNGLGIACMRLAASAPTGPWYPAAERAFMQAIAQAPVFLEPHINLGSVLYLTGRTAESMAAYNRALDIDPREPLIYFNLGNIYAREGDAARAIACWQDALDLDPAYEQARINLEKNTEKKGR